MDVDETSARGWQPHTAAGSATCKSDEQKQHELATLLDGRGYSLDPGQQQTFDGFVTMLATFDPFVVECLLSDAKEASQQEKERLSEYSGAGVSE
jgi:hypothetical protein